MDMKPNHVLQTFVFLGLCILLIGASSCEKAEDGQPAEAPAPAEAEAHPVSAKVVFTADDPGAYRGKEDSHVPEISYEKTGSGIKVRVSVEHEMNAEPPHYIEWIKVFDGGNNLLGEMAFQASDERAEVEFELSTTPSLVKAYEKCNLHGVWLNETEIIQ
jgi:superoxide reductase